MIEVMDHGRVRQDLLQEMGVQGKGLDRQPVGSFFSQAVDVIQLAQDLYGGPAAGNDQDVSHGEVLNPVAQARPQVGHVIQAAAHLDDRYLGIPVRHGPNSSAKTATA